MDTSAIRRVSILLADKKPGPFDLEIEWIRTYGKGQGRKQKSVENVSAQPKRLIATVVADGRFTILKKALDAAKLKCFFSGIIRSQYLHRQMRRPSRRRSKNDNRDDCAVVRRIGDNNNVCILFVLSPTIFVSHGGKTAVR